jgi:hypothetical protein
VTQVLIWTLMLGEASASWCDAFVPSRARPLVAFSLDPYLRQYEFFSDCFARLIVICLGVGLLVNVLVLALIVVGYGSEGDRALGVADLDYIDRDPIDGGREDGTPSEASSDRNDVLA